MEQMPRRGLLSMMSILWTTNCPSWLYAIKCGIMYFAFVVWPDDNLQTTTTVVLVVWVIASILRRLVEGVGPLVIGEHLEDVFVDLEGTIFWIFPSALLADAVIGSSSLLLALTAAEATGATANPLTLFIAGVLAFTVARLLRRATEPD